MTNLNNLAREVAKKEGLKKSVTIAQIKEILRIVLRELKAMPFKDVLQLLARIR